MSDAEPDTDAPKPKAGKKKLVILAAAVLLVGGGAGAWFSGVLPRLLGHGGEGHATSEAHNEAHGEGKAHGEGHGAPVAEARASGAPLFMDLPEIVANLNGGPRRTVFVKLKAKLELARAEDQATLTAVMPRVLDLFQGYLREMRPEELRGTAGTYRLREELLARTNLVAPPARVVSVLFTEMLVQ